MFILADKTNNIYEMPAEHYEKLLKTTSRKHIEKLTPSILSKTNLKLADRIEQFAKAAAFITLKYHKNSFINNLTCRLLNPSKNQLGKISKNILEHINKDLANLATSLMDPAVCLPRVQVNIKII